MCVPYRINQKHTTQEWKNERETFKLFTFLEQNTISKWKLKSFRENIIVSTSNQMRKTWRIPSVMSVQCNKNECSRIRTSTRFSFVFLEKCLHSIFLVHRILRFDLQRDWVWFFGSFALNRVLKNTEITEKPRSFM